MTGTEPPEPRGGGRPCVSRRAERWAAWVRLAATPVREVNQVAGELEDEHVARDGVAHVHDRTTVRLKGVEVVVQAPRELRQRVGHA